MGTETLTKKSGETGPPDTRMSSRPSRERAAEVPPGRLARSGYTARRPQGKNRGALLHMTTPEGNDHSRGRRAGGRPEEVL